jgi:D-tyrosyl-tRNA(Tyr) deacylase
MRALVQRVAHAAVEVEGRIVGRIGEGLLILVGVSPQDDVSSAEWLARKLTDLRIFADERGLMNRSLRETGGDALAVSQFTLYASTRKGSRPSYTAAALPEIAAPLFERFVAALAGELGKPVATGIFGAHMKIELCNDGPVTLWLDSDRRE